MSAPLSRGPIAEGAPLKLRRGVQSVRRFGPGGSDADVDHVQTAEATRLPHRHHKHAQGAVARAAAERTARLHLERPLHGSIEIKEGPALRGCS